MCNICTFIIYHRIVWIAVNKFSVCICSDLQILQYMKLTSYFILSMYVF